MIFFEIVGWGFILGSGLAALVLPTYICVMVFDRMARGDKQERSDGP